ncbi:hypothetical protein [Azonexus sp.]|jgi:hypothetical protein|uniref:hypothetical protein n=1 Tax=Azonexus sp. TaxID=1872668 RepID=UPI0035B2ABB1
MKAIASTLIAVSLALGAVGQANARPDHHGYYDNYRPRHIQRHYHYAPPPPPRYRHRHYDWIAPAAVVTLGAIAIGAAINSAAPPAPPPAYIVSPPPAGNWYYCRSSGQYYPYTNACPEGWVSVPAR